VIGLGGPLRQWCNKRITEAQEIAGLPLGVLAFFVLCPFSWLDPAQPEVPYSLYVRAVKTR
jgi:hypothetical protein